MYENGEEALANILGSQNNDVVEFEDSHMECGKEESSDDGWEEEDEELKQESGNGGHEPASQSQEVGAEKLVRIY